MFLFGGSEGGGGGGQKEERDREQHVYGQTGVKCASKDTQKRNLTDKTCLCYVCVHDVFCVCT